MPALQLYHVGRVDDGWAEKGREREAARSLAVTRAAHPFTSNSGGGMVRECLGLEHGHHRPLPTKKKKKKERKTEAKRWSQ